LSEVTTVRVSKTTLEMLERLREKLKVGSLDEAIRALIVERRRSILDEVFGVEKGRIRPFAEGDRGEDRS
jgi:hypothetical protein